ncbi:MAG TPA: spermidine/putrescine ABC transporter ATP-binding protein [Rikenellaceae bacterium]|nr:spermidine/putrescine ABC transporter ATP-binding protein [Rikenellaceae bacterium]
MVKNDVIINLEHISHWFGEKQVLDDVNLYIKKGEFITFLGPSGCGKTTLLRLIAGFLTPSQGIITMEGKDISALPPHKRPLNTVFQRYALFPHLDVYDNVAFGLKLQKLPVDEIDRRVEKVLKLVSMTDYEDRDVESLSGGQQQRIAIARAIVNCPKVLLLDEPLSALDLKMRKDMQIELKEMHKQLGITFVYVTHDQEEALTLSDTIVVFNDGRIQQIGTPTEIYNEPQNAFVADFIGDSNILDGVMPCDGKVNFAGHEFECVDKGFAQNEAVDVVVRPEDIYIMHNTEAAQFTAIVKSCIFKGVHYEMYVDTDKGYELLIQDYNAFEVGSEVGLIIKPSDIQVMHKTSLFNEFEGEMTSPTSVRFIDADFDCQDTGLEKGDKVLVRVDFDKVDLMDSDEDTEVSAHIRNILYKGDHYHLEVKTDEGFHLFVDTQDIWDKNDLVGIRILPEDIKISKTNV